MQVRKIPFEFAKFPVYIRIFSKFIIQKQRQAISIIFLR